MKLYTQTKAAEMLGLTRHALQDRMTSLKRRGKALSVEKGELVCLGKNFKLTAKGVARLRKFTPKPAPHTPAPTRDPVAEKEYRRRLRVCLAMGVPIEPNFREAVLKEIASHPELIEENWEASAEIESRCRYGVYVSPRE